MWMETRVSKHAKERMLKYDLSLQQIKDCVLNPHSVVEGRNKRKIAQKRLNGYVLRVIYEKAENAIIVVTAYKAKSERYEI